jgi:hypothetical protein
MLPQVTFQVGDTIVRRDIWRGYVAAGSPMIHTGDGYYLRPGTMQKRPHIGGDAFRILWFAHVDYAWRWTHVLSLKPQPGDAHSTWLMWDEEWNFLSWFVHIERPHKPTPIGFDTLDYELDVVLWPDGRIERQDEENFHRLADAGILAPDEATLALAETHRVEQVIERRDAPFNEAWPDWRPDPAWAMPTLPEDWATIDVAT